MSKWLICFILLLLLLTVLPYIYKHLVKHKDMAMQDLKTACDYDLCFDQPWLPKARLTESEELARKLMEFNNYLLGKDLDPEYVILVNMKKSSGQKRLYIYNRKNASLLYKALVTHGTGSFFNEYRLVFSNNPGSNATALGHYIIGNKYFGSYGLSYNLLGLDSTNNNAMKRKIVMHSMPCVPELERHPDWICNSYGCPAVSPKTLALVDNLLSKSEAKNMLWIYYD